MQNNRKRQRELNWQNDHKKNSLIYIIIKRKTKSK